MDGEPFEVARAAVQGVATQLRRVAEQLDEVERQVRNARMTDAMEIGEDLLFDLYPEAGPDDYAPAEDPYEFWSRTEDASILARLGGAIRLAAELVGRLEDRQPGTGRD